MPQLQDQNIDYKYSGCVCGGAGTYVLCEGDVCTLHVNNRDICQKTHASTTPLKLSKTMQISSLKVGAEGTSV